VPDPDKEVAPDTVAHRLNWIPDIGTGVTVAFLFTNRAIAQALVKRLNGGGR
jgi:hypothetical protein